MPMVEGKKFPYTAAGMKAAKKASMKHEKTEGKMERKIEYGKGLFGKKTMKKAVAKKAVAKKAVAKKMGKKK